MVLLVTRDTVTFSGADATKQDTFSVADDTKQRKFSLQKIIPDNGVVLKPVESNGAVGHQGHCHILRDRRH